MTYLIYEKDGELKMGKSMEKKIAKDVMAFYNSRSGEVKNTEKKVEEKTTEKVENNSSKTVMKISENMDEMERLHIRVIDNRISILYRPLHNYIAFVNNNEDGRGKVKELCLMSRESFGEYLHSVARLQRVTQNEINTAMNSEKEEWWKKAWKDQTDNLLKELGVENPIEKPILF